MKTMLFWIWTVLVVFGYLSVSADIVRDEVYVGPDLVFSVAHTRDLEINSEGETNIEATSPYLFLLWQSSGEGAIVGLPSTEWDRGTRFSVEPTAIQSGRWLLESEGTVKVHLTSSVAVTAKAIETGPFYVYLAMLVPAFIVWALGSVLGGDIL